MRLLHKPKKAIVPLIGILLVILMLGCGKGVVNNQASNKFDGVWEMEYTESRPSPIEPWYGDGTITIELKSVLTFESDSFNLQIKTLNSYQYLNKEYAGKYSISADTIIFNAINYTSSSIYGSTSDINIDMIEKLRYNFENHDTLALNVVGEFMSDSVMSISSTSFLWNTDGLWSNMKTSGSYSRLDTE